MNKNDIKLCIIVLLVAGLIYGVFYLTEKDTSKKATVFYENKEILSIDLNKKEYQEYTVKGFNGDVKIVTEDGKIKVDEENSPRHLCSRQGFISKSYESIICLPNKIVIQIEDSDALDTIVR